MPRIRLSLPLALAAALAPAGCTGGAELKDQLRRSDYHLPFDKRLRVEEAAPIIVLGKVLAVESVGAPRRSSADRRIKTQLTRITVSVEEAIKGSVGSDALQFYYFTYSPDASEIDLGVPRYLPGVGERRIYFLKPWRGSYRSIGDITDYTLRVSTGGHPRGFCRGLKPGCCIAEILLVPQLDADVRWFLVDLMRSEYVAEVLCSRRVASDLMQRLAEGADEQISVRAREVIAATQPAR